MHSYWELSKLTLNSTMPMIVLLEHMSLYSLSLSSKITCKLIWNVVSIKNYFSSKIFTNSKIHVVITYELIYISLNPFYLYNLITLVYVHIYRNIYAYIFQYKIRDILVFSKSIKKYWSYQ